MNGLTKVKPGDLITADFINGLIDSITTLEQKVAALEGSVSGAESVRITAFNPPPPPDGNGQNLGQVLQIFGDNFAWPPQNNIVTIQNFLVPSGGVATIANFRPGSKPTMLEFVIPTTIAGIPTVGADVTITINTGQGSTQKTYRLRPALATTGQPPVINSIKKTDGSFNLSVNETAVIAGQNFAATAAGDSIAIVIPTDTGDKRYSIPTSAISSASVTEIRFTVPDMAEITVDGIDVSLELTVGNFPSVEWVVNISRG